MGNTGGCNCSAGPTPPEKQRLDADASGSQLPSLDTWEFNALDLNPEQLGVASLVLLQAFFWGCGGADPEVLPCFICAVRDGYWSNPYHNFAHAVDVLQTVIRLGKFMPWEELISPAARFALLVAALAHDIGHPGFSNVYLVDVRDEMASRYNDISPLENMHCSRLFEITQQSQYNVLGHLSRRDFAHVRKMLIDAVLHTDTANHGYVTAALEMVYRANAEVFDASKDGKGLTMEQVDVLSTEENRALVSRALLSGADVTNQAKPWSVAYAWATLLRQELIAQGDRERHLGLAVSPMNDRHATSLAEAHIGYLHMTVVPFLAAEARLFHAWHELASTLAVNIREWGRRLSKENDVGQKPDSRIELMCHLLTSLRTTVREKAIAPNEPAEPPPVEDPSPLMVKKEARPSVDSLEEAGGPATEPCSEPSCPEAPPQPFVREIRRWREAGTANPGQQRELVLLYVVSEDIASQSPSGQPVLFRYTIQAETAGASPSSPTNGEAPQSPELEHLTKAVPQGQPALPVPMPAPMPAAPPLAAAATLPNGGGGGPPQAPSRRPSGSSAGGASSATQLTTGQMSNPQSAQASIESVCRNLDQNKFDFLLGAVLEDLPDLLQTARERRKSTSEGSDVGKIASARKQPIKNFMSKVRPQSAKDQKPT